MTPRHLAHRWVSLIGAPSSIGIKPYDDGTPRRLDRAPAELRALGLARRIGGRDRGDVLPPPYRDFDRPGIRPRNEGQVAVYSQALAGRVGDALNDGTFVLLLGGDCSVVLGALMGVRTIHERVGLVYVDAHGDFATPETSRTGSVASMCLALAVGHGDSPLARLRSDGPLVRAEDLVVIGRRDDAEAPHYGQQELRRGPMLDLTQGWVDEHGTAEAVRWTLARMESSGVDAFWIHLDADALDPAVMPAVDSPEPGGFSLARMVEILGPLARHPRALGLEVTIYDPALDPDRRSAARLVELLERVMGLDLPPPAMV